MYLLAGFTDWCSYCRYGLTAVSELLSIVVTLKGLTLIHVPSGDLQAYKEAMKMFLSSLRWLSYTVFHFPLKSYSKNSKIIS